MKRTPQENLARQLDTLPTAQAPLTAEQKQRILALACQKAGLAEPQRKPETPPAPRPALRAVRRRRRTALRTLLVAAAVVCLCTVTVFAAPALLKMLAGDIGFFAADPAATAGPLAAPRGNYDGAQPKLEAYNAAVGQSVENGGVTMTLDTIAMDVSGMDAFFTIEGNAAIQDLLGREGYEPDWTKLQALFDLLRTEVNGDETALDLMQTDYYLNDEGQLQIWAHYALTQTPQGDEITVVINAECNIGPDKESLYGDWLPFVFTVSLDGASVRAGGRQTAPGVYDLGQSMTFDPKVLRDELNYPDIDESYTEPVTVEYPLRLKHLAFGPLGGSLSVDMSTQDDPEYFGGVIAGPYTLDGGLLAIADDTGKPLYLTDSTITTPASWNLTAPDPAAASLTLTPIRIVNTPEGLERRTVTVEEMKNGAKIEITPLGGYTVRNFAIEDHAITYELVPYGVWTGGDHSLAPNAEGLISLAEGEATVLGGEQDGETVTAYHSGLYTETVDGVTGVITVRHDYYAATRAQIESIPSFRYVYDGGNYTLDTAHAVTLPLEPVA